jgi:hypothetical protein
LVTAAGMEVRTERRTPTVDRSYTGNAVSWGGALPEGS